MDTILKVKIGEAMEKFVWDEKYEIGVEIVDRAHAKLFRITNKLQEISEDALTNQAAYKEGIWKHIP